MSPSAASRLPLDLSVGEVARRSGVAVSTIHFYEAEGLIEGWRRAQSGSSDHVTGALTGGSIPFSMQ